MIKKIKEAYMLQKIKRAERKARPWGKKQKIIFLVFLGIMIVYIAVSTIIASNNSVDQGGAEQSQSEVVIPTLELNINGFDVAALCIIGGAIAVIKIRKYIKDKKGE